MFTYQKPYYLFAAAAFAGFGVQGFVSNTGALSVVFPNLPFPIPYINGRTFHANVGIYWTFLGLMGGAFYFFREEIEKAELLKIVNLTFYGLAGIMLMLQGSLVLMYPVGREYLEGPALFRAALVLPFLLLIYTHSLVYRRQALPLKRTAALCILTGVILLFFAYLATLIFYQYPPLEWLSEFLAFHVIAETGAALLAIALLCLLLQERTGINPHSAENPLIAALLLAAGVVSIAILEYYILPGSFYALLLMALAFSGLHALPVFLLLYTILKQIRLQTLMTLDRRSTLAMLLTGGAVFYYLFGAGMLGFVLAYPGLHPYLHSTYVASAHAHLALFGVFGMTTLALAIYILFEHIPISAAEFKWMAVCVIIFNSGLLLMGIMLMIAGGLEAYMASLLGGETPEVDGIVRPYLFGRVAGSALYAFGNVLFSAVAFRLLWRYRRVFLGLSPQEQAALQDIHRDYSQLIRRQHQVREQLANILTVYKALFSLKRKNRE